MDEAKKEEAASTGEPVAETATLSEPVKVKADPVASTGPESYTFGGLTRTIDNPGEGHKVAIVGFAPTWVKAPFDDKSFEIWACNEFYLHKKRIDVLFELHSPAEIVAKDRNKKHREWLKASPIPIFMREPYKDIPKCVVYPRDAILEAFPRRYFTNTISWQIALAIKIGFKEIHLYGINMATDEEYAAQRPSCEYFVGWAEGMGIKVVIPDESDLCKCWFLYGFEQDQLSVMAKRMKNFETENQQREAQFRNVAETNVAMMHQARGAISATQYIQKAFVYPNVSFNEMPKPSTEGGEGG